MRSTLALLVLGSASLLATSGNVAAEPETDPTATCANSMRWEKGANYKAGDGAIGFGGNLFVCKAGASSDLCDELGYEPERDDRALDVWQKVPGIDPCQFPAAPEYILSRLEVTNVVCKGTLAVVTIAATIMNDNAFGFEKAKIAFYDGNKKLISVEKFDLPNESYDPITVTTTWRTTATSSGTAIIEADVNVDEEGMAVTFEFNKSDNMIRDKYVTCPVPKTPGPVQP
ncbi:MAG: hypothetical protein ABW133_21040 [Polyangiaceae bacterium]